MTEIVHTLTDGVLRHLAVGSMAALVLVLLALALLKAAHIRTPVYRHMVWLYCLVGIVGLPLIWLYSPKLTLAVLPADARTHVVVALPVAGLGMEEPLPDAALTPPRPLTAEPPSAPPEAVLSWKTAAAAAWLLGFSLMLTRLAAGWLRLRRICRSAAPLQASECPLGLAHPQLRLSLTDQLLGPVCFGMFRPVVLLPQDIVRTGSPEELQMVLTHELAHIERRDCWANLFQRIVEAVYFFHPLVWLASRQLTQQREEICDNHVLAGGVSADDYTTLLSHLGAQSVRAGYLQTVALFEGQLLSRIRSLLDPTRSRQTRLPCRIAALGTIVVLAGFLALGSIRLAAQPSDRTTASPERPSSSAPVAEQKLTQSLRGAASDSEEPEQPRFAARTFNSDVAFSSVFIQKTPRSIPFHEGWAHDFLEMQREAETAWVGYTPSIAPLQIPACHLWWVGCEAPGQHWDSLIREIKQKKIPALALGRATDGDVAHLAGLTELQGLDIRSNRITDEGLTHLKNLKKLEWLQLSYSQITDAGLAQLKNLTELRALGLCGTQITGAGLRHLAGLTKLQYLSLDNTPITDADLEHLKGLTGLRRIVLSQTQVPDAGLAHLKSLTELEELDLSHNRLTDGGLAHLQSLPQLHQLFLHGCPGLADGPLEHLKGLTGLQVLGLWGNYLRDGNLTYLEDLTTLCLLDLGHTWITDAGLTHLKGLTGLQHLYLGDNPIADAGLESLKNLTELRNLDLSDTQVTDAGLEHLKSLTGLESLRLIHCPITGPGLTHLKGMTQLRELRLNGTQIAGPGLEHLKALTALQQLSLCETQITDAGLAHIEGMTRPSVLDLTRTHLTDAALEHLQGLTGVRTLVLKDNKITGAGLTYLRNLPALQKLLLDDNPITDGGLACLPAMAGLTVLSLDQTKITDAGLAHLEGMTGLLSLQLAGTQITDAGLVHLKGLTALEELSLRGTQVTDAGLEHLQGRVRLRYLTTRDTRITQAAKAQLTQNLPSFIDFEQ